MDSARGNAPLRLRCDASALPADADMVDQLARLTLCVRRHGGTLTLWRASPELTELIAFMGLAGVLPEEG